MTVQVAPVAHLDQAGLDRAVQEYACLGLPASVAVQDGEPARPGMSRPRCDVAHRNALPRLQETP